MDTSIEFDHFLAQKLSMTVAAMRHNISNAEYVSWSIYFARIAQRQELARK